MSSKIRYKAQGARHKEGTRSEAQEEPRKRTKRRRSLERSILSLA